jgi:hypothetical protein
LKDLRGFFSSILLLKVSSDRQKSSISFSISGKNMLSGSFFAIYQIKESKVRKRVYIFNELQNVILSISDGYGAPTENRLNGSIYLRADGYANNDFYIRRLRVNKSESIYFYLMTHVPELMEDDFFRSHDTAILSVPQMAPEGSILRTESALSLLNRVKFIHDEWIKPGHTNGQNTHNVSATISIKDDEWVDVGEWMWKNRDSYNGLSVLPYSDHTYKQAPFEDITKEKYDELYNKLDIINLNEVYEIEDTTNLMGEIACSGGSCEIV